MAALRHRACPVGSASLGLVLGALTVVAGVSPLEYMAGLPGQLRSTVTGIGFAVGDRAFRAGDRAEIAPTPLTGAMIVL